MAPATSYASGAASATALDESIRRDALTGAIANGLINAGVSGWLLRGGGPQALSVDSIATTEHTVLGSAVTLAVSLAFILSSITFFTFRKKLRQHPGVAAARVDRPYVFFGLRHAVGASLSMFGLVVAVAVLWQRWLGTLVVSVPVAALIAGTVAALVSYAASVRMSTTLLRE